MVHILMLLLAVPSQPLAPRGDAEPSVIHLAPGSGLTADMVLPPPFADASTEDVEPGVVPEGDYLMDIAFTADGQQALICNYMSGNVTVLDWSEMEVDTTFSTDGGPGGVACTDQYAVVAFPFEDRVDVISLSDWSVAASFATGEQPWVVEVSEDGSEAYVGCDIDDVCEVIDLATLSKRLTISGFPVWLSSYGWGSESNRYYVRFSEIQPLPGSASFAVGDGESSVLVYSSATGSVEETVSVPECGSMGLAGDGSKLLCLSAADPVAVHRIDLSTFTVDASVSVTGYTSGTAKDVVANGDGSKAYISTSSNTSTLVRMDAGTAKTFSSTYSAFWLGVSPDHSLAVSGQYRFSIIDFSTEEMVGQHQGNSQYIGAVSPVANGTASYDPMRNEAAYLYSFDASGVTYHGEVLSGSPVEGDGCRRAAVSPDGTVAVVSNTLSDNASFIDLGTMETVAVLEMGDRVQDVAVTPDSKYAVVCCFNSNSVKLVDLDTFAVVAEVPTGSRAGVVSVEPDGSHAWVGNISANTVSVVELDGASSTEVEELSVGVIGVSYVATGVSSDVAVSPDGSVCLVCASFDDEVHVIDTSSYTIVATLPVGDFPLQVSFTDDGSRALVTNYIGDSYSLLDIDGASSSVVGTWSAGDGPLRTGYDSAGGMLAYGLYGDDEVRMVDPETGSVTDSHSYPESVLDIQFADDGSRLALTASGGSATPCMLHRDDESFELSGAAVYFDYSDAADLAVAVSPGPDWAMVVDWGPQGIEGGRLGAGSVPGLAVSPNPASGALSFRVVLPAASAATLSVYDLGGRLVDAVAGGSMPAGSSSYSWTPSDEVPAGVYCARLEAGGRVRSRLVTLVR
jgi:YVTN family beta-propeller protein